MSSSVSFVSGTGFFLPPDIMSNKDLEKLVDTSDAWIEERTGIKNRHIAKARDATSDLAYPAAVDALQEAGVLAADLDMIIVATVSGDQVMPSTACVLQARLGAHRAAAFDILAACSGFIYALSVADQFIKSNQCQNILVVGAEVLHGLVNYEDRQTCILFGDGAGAWVVSKKTNPNSPAQIHSSFLAADGSLGDLFILPGGGSRMPFSKEVLEQKKHFVEMKGKEIFKHAVRTMSHCVNHILEQTKWQAQDIDWLIPHQANSRILSAVADQLHFPKEKLIESLSETGNTSAASIPLAFGLALKEGKIKRGDKLILAAFGAGLTSGSLALTF